MHCCHPPGEVFYLEFIFHFVQFKSHSHTVILLDVSLWFFFFFLCLHEQTTMCFAAIG